MVLGKFMDAALTHLTTLQRVEITRSFRQGIEEALSLMDDVSLPAEYHPALLELANAILATLGSGIGEARNCNWTRRGTYPIGIDNKGTEREAFN
jgi:hypothetical protein